MKKFKELMEEVGDGISYSVTYEKEGKTVTNHMTRYKQSAETRKKLLISKGYKNVKVVPHESIYRKIDARMAAEKKGE